MMASVEEDERSEELSSLTAIYPEIVSDPSNPFAVSLQIAVQPSDPLLVRFMPLPGQLNDASYSEVAASTAAHVERDIRLTHLPPLDLRITLPKDYPINLPPEIRLSSKLDWLPNTKLLELESDAANLWTEYGGCQILFAYIDHLQQSAERGFDLIQGNEGCLVLPIHREPELVAFDNESQLHVFNQGTYDCGVCLEPKKGSSCYKMAQCAHVFCRACLQDFYNNAIKEGDVNNVRCLDPQCGKQSRKPSSRKSRTLHPRELLNMGIEESVVRRYLEMKRKKRLEGDRSTVYCPRTWCQGAAKSTKYPLIPDDLTLYSDPDASSEEDDEKGTDGKSPTARTSKTKQTLPDPSDRLAVCEKCKFAFCKVCYMGWHGSFARCYPRDPGKLSEEELASYEYIRAHTSPCAYCNAPVQKTMGCNHMCCFVCNTHFCYLCGAYLEASSPYQHFNKPGTPCFQKLWVLEEGDEAPGGGAQAGVARARGWEQLAMEAAREAELAEQQAAEAEELAARLQMEEFEQELDELMVAQNPPPAPPPPPPPADAAAAPAADPRQARRRARHPFVPAAVADAQAPGLAPAVRRHERQRTAQRQRHPRPPPGALQENIDPRPPRADRHPLQPVPLVQAERQAPRADGIQQHELQRFIEMALRDEEDGWDSDDLGGDDNEFEIR